MQKKLLPFLFLLFLSFSLQISAQDKDAQIQEAIAVYTKLLKSEDAARSLVAQIDLYTNHSPYALSTNLSLGQRMLVAEVPRSSIVSTLTACGDMAAALNANDEGFGELTLRMIALRSSADKDNFIHFAVLNRYGIPVYKMIGEAIGKSPEIAERLALQGRLKSSVAFEVLNASFERDYKGIAEEVAKKRKG